MYYPLLRRGIFIVLNRNTNVLCDLCGPGAKQVKLQV